VKLNHPLAWRRLIAIYGPLVYRWSRQAGLQVSDVDDIVGDVFVDLVTGVDRFENDGNPHSFRRWLRTITTRKIQLHFRRQNARPVPSGGSSANVRLQTVANDHSADEDPRDEVDWVRQQAAKILRDDCQPRHWQVFQRSVLNGEVPEEVATALGMSVWSVYKIRSRLLHRLRSELDELS
jgi:RNA polymerase sigma-70 factor (ECF subfamily)